MGFGDFAMGYLVGQSFSGPNHIPDGNTPYSEWSSQAKKDWDKKCDEAYWRAWDKACKEKVIERLRNHEEGFSFFSTKTQDEQADLIESGELRIAAPTQGMGEGLGLVWADENREETKGSKYQENLKIIMNKVKEGVYRIVI